MQVWTGLPVTGLRSDGPTVPEVATAQGALLADTVIHASGTAPSALLDPSNLSLTMLPRPGLFLAVMHSGVTLPARVHGMRTAKVSGQGIVPALAPLRPARLLRSINAGQKAEFS